MPGLGELLIPPACGALLSLTGIVILLVSTRGKALFVPVEADQAGAAGKPVQVAGPREKWQMTLYVSLALLVLLAGVYAWCIGFGAYGGTVEAKSVSSLGRYGDYTLQIGGETVRISRAVNALATVGSEVNRPRGRPYVLVDGTAVVMTFPLVILGMVGAVLLCLWALLLWLTWSAPGPEA